MTVVMNNRFISEKIYLFTLFIWVVVASLVTTTYFIRLDGFLSLYRLLLYFTIIMLLIKELMNFPKTLYYFRFHWQQLLIVTAFFIAMFIVAKNREGLLDLNVLLLVFSARDIDFRKLLGTFSFATFLVLVLTIFASNMGVISNMIMRADSGYRFSLGFNYVSFASQRLFFALCSYLMFRGEKISYMELLVLLSATIYMYQQTSTSSPFYLSILILAYALFSLKIIKKDFIVESFWLKKVANYEFDYEKIINIYKKNKILVHASYVIGYDYDDKNCFDEILEFSKKHKFFLAGFNPALPIPGTPFYERLKKEGRLLYERWWLDENFRYGKACFEPYNMTIEEFEAGILKCKVEYNKHSSIWKRLFDGAANFKHALVFLAVNYINRKEVYNKKGIKL